MRGNMQGRNAVAVDLRNSIFNSNSIFAELCTFVKCNENVKLMFDDFPHVDKMLLADHSNRLVFAEIIYRILSEVMGIPENCKRTVFVLKTIQIF